MAFKIDFSKLGARSAEERRADEKAAYERLMAHRIALVEERKQMVLELVPHKSDGQTFSKDDLKFLNALEYKASTFDLDGLAGGELAVLSERQVEYLRGLFKRISEVQK